MKCLHCGYEMPDTAKFCKQCGYPAGWKPDVENNINGNTGTASEPWNSEIGRQVPPKIRVDKKVLLIICLICVAALLILFIAIYPYLSQGTSTAEETETPTETVEPLDEQTEEQQEESVKEVVMEPVDSPETLHDDSVYDPVLAKILSDCEADSLYYAYLDVNSDGVNEFLAAYNDTETAEFLYTQIEGQPVKLIDNRDYVFDGDYGDYHERPDYINAIHPNGTIVVSSFLSIDALFFQEYVLETEGRSLSPLGTYMGLYDLYTEDGKWNYFYERDTSTKYLKGLLADCMQPPGTQISEDEFDAWYDTIGGIGIQANWVQAK